MYKNASDTRKPSLSILTLGAILTIISVFLLTSVSWVSYLKLVVYLTLFPVGIFGWSIFVYNLLGFIFIAIEKLKIERKNVKQPR